MMPTVSLEYSFDTNKLRHDLKPVTKWPEVLPLFYEINERVTPRASICSFAVQGLAAGLHGRGTATPKE